MQRILLTAIPFLLLSCSAKIRFVGQRSTPVNHTDVYVTETAIQKKYVISGQGYLNLWAARLRPDKIQALAEKKALENGADAVLITDYYIPNTGQAINTVYRTDTLDRAVISTGSTTITSLSSSGYRVFFIKYLK